MTTAPTPAASADELPKIRPWPGLNKFTRDHKFCGRQDDIEDLHRRLRLQVGTVLYGQSGLGKSSLLDAGLVPRLQREHYLPVDIRLIHKADAASLIDQVRDQLRKAMHDAGLFEPVLPAPGEDLWRYLHRRDVPWLFDDGHDARPVLIFDQFEEIFTNGQSTPELARRSKEFFTELADLIQGRPSAAVSAELASNPDAAQLLKQGKHDYHVLIVLREDYLPHLDTAVERFEAPDLVSNRQRLLPFNGLRAMEAVEGPGEGLLEDGVAERIVRKVASARQRHVSVAFMGEDDDAPMDLADLRVEPALLSLLCSRLNEARLREEAQTKAPAKITAALLEKMGGQVLDDYYREAIAALPEKGRAPMSAFIEDKLISESGMHRQQIPLDTVERVLADHGVSPALTKDCITELVSRQRLLRIEDRGDVPRLELTHDVLCEVAGRSRERRRAWQQRLQWWKNAAAVAAVVLFVSSVFFAGYALVQRKEAMAQREQAEQKADEARTQAKAAQAATQKANDARARALSVTSRWYGERIQEEAARHDLGAASLLGAKAVQDGALASPLGTSFVAATPLIELRHKLEIGEQPRTVEWLHKGRELLVTTMKTHACVAGVAVRWFVRRDDALTLEASHSPRAPARLADVLAAIPWRDESKTPGALLSLKGEGLWFLPAGSGTARKLEVAIDADITALAQSDVNGDTWAGTARGLTLKLSPDGRSVDWTKLCYTGDRVKERTFDDSAESQSVRQRWRYKPIEEPDADSRASALPASRSTDAGSWELFVRDRGQKERKVNLPASLLRIRPDALIYSPDEQYCLITGYENGETTHVLLSASAQESKNAGSAEKTREDTGDPSKDDKPAPAISLKLVGEVAFLDSNWLLEAGADGRLSARQLPGGDVATSIELIPAAETDQNNEKEVKAGGGRRALARLPFDGAGNGARARVSRFFVSDDGGHVIALMKSGQDEIPGALIIVKTVRAERKLLLEIESRWDFPPDSGWDADSIRVTTLRQGGGVLLQHPDHNGKPVTEMLAFGAGNKPQPLDWQRIGGLLPDAPIGGLAMDHAGGILCMSAVHGVGFIDTRSGALLDDMVLSWRNPKPWTVECDASMRRSIHFRARIDRNRFWQLGISPYRSDEAPPFSIDLANRERFNENIASQGTAFGAWSAEVRDLGELVLTRNAVEIDRAPFVDANIEHLRFSHDTRCLASASNKGAVCFWQIANPPGAEELNLFAESGKVKVTPQMVELQKGRLAISDISGVHAWQPDSGLATPLPLPDKTRRVLGLGRGVPDQSPATMLCDTLDGHLVLADVADGKQLAVGDLAVSTFFAPVAPNTKKLHTVERAVISDDGKWMALFGPDDLVEMWSREAGGLNPLKFKTPLGGKDIAFDLNGVALLLGKDSTQALNLQAATAATWKIRIACAAFMPGTKLFIAGLADGGIVTLNPRDPLDENNVSAIVPTVAALHESRVRALIVSRTHPLAAAVAQSDDEGVLVIDLSDRRVIGPMHHMTSGDAAAGGVFMSDGSLFAGLSKGAVRVSRSAQLPAYGELVERCGRSVDDGLRVLNAERSASKGPPKQALPPEDETLAESLAIVNRADFDVRSGDSGGRKKEPEESLNHVLKEVINLQVSAGTPPLLHDLQDLAARTPSPRTAMLWMDFLDKMDRSAVWSGGTGNAWPGSLRADVDRYSKAAQMQQALGSEPKLLNEDESDLTPEAQKALEPYQEALESAMLAGSFRQLPRAVERDVSNAMETLAGKKQTPQAKDVAARASRLIALLSAWKSGSWNSATVDLESRSDFKTKGDRQRAAALGYQRSVWIAERFPEDSAAIGYPLANWAYTLKELSDEAATDVEKDEMRSAALTLVREATKREPDNAYAWGRVKDISVNDDERLQAAEKAVKLREGSTAKDKLKDARHTLGSLQRELGRIDEAMTTFEAVLKDFPDDIYSIVEVGDLLRSAGASPDEWRPWFAKAAEMEKSKALNECDVWGRRQWANACEQAGIKDEAQAIYLDTISIEEAKKDREGSTCMGLVRLAIARNDRDGVLEQAKQIIEIKAWESLAILARFWKQWQPADSEGLARTWSEMVLTNTSEAVKKEWEARVWALDALDRTDEAVQTLIDHVSNASSEEKDEGFWRRAHFDHAAILARKSPRDAVGHLALAVSHGWHDGFWLITEPVLAAALKNDANFGILRDALARRYDQPDRHLGLAAFVLESPAVPGAIPDGDASPEAAAARILAQAVRLGWTAADSAMSKAPFDRVKAWKGWPDTLAEARRTVLKNLRAEIEAVAAAINELETTGTDETDSQTTATKATRAAWESLKQSISQLKTPAQRASLPDALRAELWTLLRDRIVGHSKLKRDGGRDVFGNELDVNFAANEVRVAAATRAQVEAWSDVDEDSWSASFDFRERLDSEPATDGSSFPTARPGSRPGRVISPFPPFNEVDVTGLDSGSLALDPTTQKVFKVP